MIQSKAHLSEEGIKKILDIRSDMNDGGKRRYQHHEILATLVESSETTRQAFSNENDDIVRSLWRHKGSDNDKLNDRD